MIRRKRYDRKKTVLMLLICVLLAAGCGLILYQIYPALSARLANDLPAMASQAASSKPQSSKAAASSTPPPVSSEPAKPAPTGMFASTWQSAEERLSTMTVEEKVGQIFVFRCPSEGAVKAVDDYQPGGYCLMGNFFKNKTADQVRAAINSYQKSSKIPMIMCCDEEGGTVVRISSNPALAEKKFGSPQQVFKAGGMEGVASDATAKAKMMLDLGLNLNLAPVCDISTNANDFMFDRSFGRNATATSTFVSTVVTAFENEGLCSTLKHFPGYGNNGDTHTDVVYDKRDYANFVQSDFLPFQAGINAGAECVLVSHNIVESIDPKYPASLSPKVLGVLRNELGFTGIIMTDDLVMDGVMNFTAGKSPCVAAFNAGNDILLSSNMKADYDAVLAAVKNGTITLERLDESVTRILAFKYAKII